MAADGLQIPQGMELVKASGTCGVCDFKFRDEEVLRYEAPALTGGYGYMEVRHLKDTDFADIWSPASAKAPDAGTSR